MASTQRSPMKFAPTDWHTSNYVISSSADNQRKISHDLRQQSQIVRNETESRTRWTQHGTDSELTFRVGDIEDWKKALTIALQNVETEMSKLNEHKGRTETSLELKNMPLEVVLECLSNREHRISIDLVRDEVEYELQKEFEVIEGVRSLLHQKIGEAFEELCILQDCHEQLYADLTDKHEAIQIDTTCVELNEKSNTISFQVDPTRIKKGIVTPRQWGSFSHHNTARAEAELQVSARIREAINQTIRQTVTDLEAQWTVTNYAFRKRVHEIEQAKTELEWQKEKTEKEIAEIKNTIQDLEVSLSEKASALMLVHTRLENRIYRPNVELCRDQPQYDMVEEVAQIEESIRILKDKIELTKHTLGTLERTLARIMEDLRIKNNSLQIDKECLEIRQRLSQHPKANELAEPKSS